MSKQRKPCLSSSGPCRISLTSLDGETLLSGVADESLQLPLRVYVWNSRGEKYSQVLIIAAISLQEAQQIIIETMHPSLHFLAGCEPDDVIASSGVVFSYDIDW